VAAAASGVLTWIQAKKEGRRELATEIKDLRIKRDDLLDI